MRFENVEDDPFSYRKLLPVNSELSRVGQNELVQTRATRGKASELQLNPAYRTPQFFAPGHVAVIYGQPGYTFYKYKLTEPLTILSFADERGVALLELLWKETDSVPQDRAIVKELSFMLGAVPRPYKTDSIYTEMRAWAEGILKDEPLITLDEAYPNRKADFNRISSTKKDRLILNTILSHPFRSEIVRSLFESCDGLYFPPMNCGFENRQNFMTLMGTFHEELVLKEPVVRNLVKTAVINQFQLPTQYVGAYRRIQLISNDYDIHTAFQNYRSDVNPDDIEMTTKAKSYQIEDPMETNYDTMCQYIFSFQTNYLHIFNRIDRYVQDIDAMEARIDAACPYAIQQRHAIRDFKRTFQENLAAFQITVYKTLESAYLLNAQHFVNLPAEDPFVKDGEFNEELFLFTVVSDFVKAGINGFENLLGEFSLDMFKPIASGGILFGAYSFGKFRRLTKDIDIKIGQNDNDKKRHPHDQEYLHTKLTVLIYIWEHILADILTTIATYRVKAFISHLPESYTVTRSHGNDKYEGYIGTVRSSEKHIDVLADNTLIRNSQVYVPGTLFGMWNTYLQENQGMTLFQYNEMSSKLLKTKYELKQGIQTPPEGMTLEQSITTINQQKKNLDEMFGDFLNLWLGGDSAKNFHPYLMFHYTLQKLRPFIGEDTSPLKIGFFSSLWIRANRSQSRSYGLIDFTFDTPYALEGTYQFPSKIDLGSVVKHKSLVCASYLDFIRETIKLKEICSRDYPFDDITSIEVNPYNKCSPNKEKREQKLKKYTERYNLVFALAKTISYASYPDLSAKIQGSETLEEILQHLEGFIEWSKTTGTPITEKKISTDLLLFSASQQKNEPLIGGSSSRHGQRRKTRRLVRRSNRATQR